MGKIVHRKGDLFAAAKDNNILVHACNCQGVWGSGVAKQFKDLSKDFFEMYKEACDEAKADGDSLMGTATLLHVGAAPYRVACLFTSNDFGERLDPEGMIIKNTYLSIRNLISIAKEENQPLVLHSPKINAGLFRVPWERTENIILDAIQAEDIEWNVWSKND